MNLEMYLKKEEIKTNVIEVITNVLDIAACIEDRVLDKYSPKKLKTKFNSITSEVRNQCRDKVSDSNE